MLRLHSECESKHSTQTHPHAPMHLLFARVHTGYSPTLSDTRAFLVNLPYFAGRLCRAAPVRRGRRQFRRRRRCRRVPALRQVAPAGCSRPSTPVLATTPSVKAPLESIDRAIEVTNDELGEVSNPSRSPGSSLFCPMHGNENRARRTCADSNIQSGHFREQ